MAGVARTASENMVKIDGEKLYEQFKERGLQTTKLCADIGVNSGYFSNAKYRSSMANMMIVLLESRYGIPRNTYVVEEKKEPETTVVEVVSHDNFFSEDNMKKLYQLMYSAMYNAVKQALNE